MALKFKYATEGEIPAEHKAFYVARDGAWFLDAEGAADKAKLDEFRNNNVQLQKQLAAFAGIDPVKAADLIKRQQELDEQNLIKTGDVEKIVTAKLAPILAEKQKLEAQFADLTINQAAVAAATKRGLRASAVQDLHFRARAVFRLHNGVPTAFEADGKTIKLSADGVTPLTLDAWAEGLVAEAPHLFEQSSGSGANGGGSGGAGFKNANNPFAKETWNLTQQGVLLRTNPVLAKQLQSSAK